MMGKTWGVDHYTRKLGRIIQASHKNPIVKPEYNGESPFLHMFDKPVQVTESEDIGRKRNTPSRKFGEWVPSQQRPDPWLLTKDLERQRRADGELS